MLAVTLAHLGVFPAWLRAAVVVAWGLTMVVAPIYAIVKMLQAACMKAFFRAVLRACKGVGDFLQQQVEDPYKYPRIERILRYVAIVNSYIMAVILFLYFALVVTLWVFTAKHLTALDHIYALAFSLACAYMAAVLKAQAGTELFKLRSQ